MDNFISKNKNVFLAIVAVLILLIGGTYAWYTMTLSGNKTVKIHAGKLSLDIDESASEGISISNAYPMTDQEGLATPGYSFTLKNDGNIASTYTIYLVDLELDEGKTRMPDSAVKYNLKKTEYNDDATEKKNATETKQLLSLTGTNPNRILDTGTLQPGEYNTYLLKTWMDYSAGNDSQGTVFKTQIKVEGVQIKE